MDVIPFSDPGLYGPTPANPGLTVGRAVPRPGLPAKGTLDYVKVAVEVLLLLLALPWLIKQLFSHPGQVSHQAAAHHLGKP